MTNYYEIFYTAVDRLQANKETPTGDRERLAAGLAAVVAASGAKAWDKGYLAAETDLDVYGAGHRTTLNPYKQNN
jgi:hypothetical protein